MQGTGHIWLVAESETWIAHLQELFSRSRLLNPVTIFSATPQLVAAVTNGNRPDVVFLEVGVQPCFLQNALRLLASHDLTGRVIALVEDATEKLLDSTCELGVHAHLRRGFTFAEFLNRARSLGLQFVLTGNDGSKT